MSQIKAFAQGDRARTDAGLSLKNYTVPLLDCRVASIWYFEGTFHISCHVRHCTLADQVDPGRVFNRDSRICAPGPNNFCMRDT